MPENEYERRLREFAELVDPMRSAQREYFRTRNRAALTQSKSRERDVDEATKEILADPRSRLF